MAAAGAASTSAIAQPRMRGLIALIARIFPHPYMVLAAGPRYAIDPFAARRLCLPKNPREERHGTSRSLSQPRLRKLPRRAAEAARPKGRVRPYRISEESTRPSDAGENTCDAGGPARRSGPQRQALRGTEAEGDRLHQQSAGHRAADQTSRAHAATDRHSR